MDGMPGLTPAWGEVLAEAASVCLAKQGHAIRTVLKVDGTFEESFLLERLSVSLQMTLSHRNEEEATELGACGVAILAVRSLTDLVVLHRSRKGTGFDYWLSSEEDFLLQRGVRLEVSGIRKGTEAAIKGRTSEKMKQTQRFRTESPAWIAVVEFSRPLLRLMKVSRPALRIMKP
jgi:glycerol kinase